MSGGFTISQQQRATPPAVDPRQLVTFVIGREEFGIDILRVQEINRLMDLTRVPQAPPEVEGVVNLRGKIIPVLDLAKRFNLPSSGERTEATRIVVVEVGGRTLGFLVDRVREVLRLDPSRIEPAPALVGAIDADYVTGVGKLEDRLVVILDIDRVFADDRGQGTGDREQGETAASGMRIDGAGVSRLSAA